MDGATYRREAILLALELVAILAACFGTFLFGDASLMESAREGPSLYSNGAVASDPPHAFRVVDNASGYITEPWLALEHRIVVDEHRLPLWDAYDGYGAPFAAAMQPQPFYPLTALLALHPSPRGFSWWLVARLFLCGWFAALFVRLFADSYAALAAGVSCALSGYFLAYLNMPHVSVEVTLPVLLWATELLCRRVTGPRIAALSFSAGLAYLGGMPEAAFLALGVTFAYSVVRLSATRHDRLKIIGALAVGQALGLALGAIQLLPFVEYVGSSFNIHDVVHSIGLATDPAWVHGLLFELVPRAFGSSQESILTPARGYTGLRGFVGCASAMLALFALVAAFRWPACRSIILLLGAIAAYAFLKRFGSPLVNWTGQLPLLRIVFLAKYLEPILGISVALLAGFGIAALRMRRLGSIEILTGFAAILVVLNLLYKSTSHEVVPGPLGAVYFDSFTLALIVTALTGIAAWCVSIRAGVARSVGSIFLVAGLVAEPFVGYLAPTYWFNSASLRVNPYRGAPYVKYLQDKLAISRGRVLGSEVLFPNWAGAFGISDPRSLNALYPSAYLPFVNAFLNTDAPSNQVNGYDRFVAADRYHLESDLGRRWLQLSSIEYVLSDPNFEIGTGQSAPSFLQVAYRAPGVTVFHVAGALPRLALIHRVRTVRTFDAALAVLTSPHFDVAHNAVVIGDRPPIEAANGPENVTVTDVRSDRVIADVRASSAALLLQNDTWFPGWFASIDGREMQILKADGMFRGIPIPAGRHVVEIAYRPTSAYAGAAISLAALLACLALVLVGLRQAGSHDVVEAKG